MACTYCASMPPILVLMPPSLGPFSVLIRLILLSASCTLQTCSQPAPPWAPPCPKSLLLPQGPRALRQGFARTPISETRSAGCQMLQPATLMCDALGLEMPGLRRDAQTSRGNAPPTTRGGEGGGRVAQQDAQGPPWMPQWGVGCPHSPAGGGRAAAVQDSSFESNTAQL